MSNHHAESAHADEPGLHAWGFGFRASDSGGLAGVPATRERSRRLQSCNAILPISFDCCDGLRMCQVTVRWLHLLGERESPDGLTGGDELGVTPRSGDRISDAILTHNVMRVVSYVCLPLGLCANGAMCHLQPIISTI